MDVLVSDFGVMLGKTSERLTIRKDGETIREVPLLDIESLTVASKGVTISSDLIRECAARDILLFFADMDGDPYARILSVNSVATVRTRREQLLAYQDFRGVDFTKQSIAGKIRNQSNVIRYFSKYRKHKEPELYDRLMEIIQRMDTIFEELKQVMGCILKKCGKRLCCWKPERLRSIGPVSVN